MPTKASSLYGLIPSIYLPSQSYPRLQSSTSLSHTIHLGGLTAFQSSNSHPETSPSCFVQKVTIRGPQVFTLSTSTLWNVLRRTKTSLTLSRRGSFQRSLLFEDRFDAGILFWVPAAQLFGSSLKNAPLSGSFFPAMTMHNEEFACQAGKRA